MAVFIGKELILKMNQIFFYEYMFIIVITSYS